MTDSEFKKTSIRTNAIENRRLELVVSTYEKNKRNVATDISKSQAEYKHRLKYYKERQREIMLSKTEAPSSASFGEFLLHQIISRRSPSSVPRPVGVSAKRKEVARDVNSRNTLVSKTDHSISMMANTPLTVDNSLKSGQKPKSSSLSKEGSRNHIKHPETSSSYVNNILPTYNENNKSSIGIVNCEPQIKFSSPSNNDNRSQSIPFLVRTHEKTNPSGELRVRSRPKTAPLELNHWQEKSRKEEQKLMNPLPKPRMGVYTRPVTSVNKELREPLETSSESENYEGVSEMQAEYEANEELGRLSHLQRSKLDLRPSTAWSQYQSPPGSSYSDELTGRKGQTQLNPFQGTRGNLGEFWRQVRYFDEEEIVERGLFYNLLLKSRLEREHTNFEDICAKVNSFCGENDVITGSDRQKGDD